jgi:predicted KAP-like P-loop ATPase
MEKLPTTTSSPQIDPKEDFLGIHATATLFAESLMSVEANDGYVTAVTGEWGIGKTTFVNFVKTELKKISNENEKDKEKDQIILIDFNPWLFSNREDLIQRFLIELNKILLKSPLFNKDELEAFSNFIIGMSCLAIDIKSGFSIGQTVKPFLKKLVRTAIKDKPLQEQKENINTLLKNKQIRIFVFIDDIDRLDKTEMVEIFRMVKAVADFTNIIYVLNFDIPLVAKVIEEIHPSTTVSYLDKIIQYEFPIPKPDQYVLFDILLNKPLTDGKTIKASLNDLSLKRIDEFFKIYLLHFLKTPRELDKIYNHLKFNYPPIKNDVNLVDFIIISSLLILHPEIHGFIMWRKDKIFNYPKYLDFAKDIRETKNIIYTDLKNTIQSDEVLHDKIKPLIGFLFPQLSGKLDKNAKIHFRICDADHFDTYFKLYTSAEFSSSKINKLIGAAQDPTKLKNAIMPYADKNDPEKSKHRESLLRVLSDMIDDNKITNHKALENIIVFMFENGDNLIHEIYETGPAINLLRSAIYKYKELTSDELDFITESINNTSSPFIAIRFIEEMAISHRLSNHHPIFESSIETPILEKYQVQNLINLIDNKLENDLNDQLLNHPFRVYITFIWSLIKGSDNAKRYTRKILDKNDKQQTLSLLSEIMKFISKERPFIIDFEKMIDISYMKSKLNYIQDHNSLTEQEIKDMDSFIETFNDY